MADAWLQARTAQMDEDLIPKAAAVAASSGSRDRPAVDVPAPKASMLKRSRMVQASASSRTRSARTSPGSCRSAAQGVFTGEGDEAAREVTPERYSQWQSALDRMAKQKVTEAEGATVLNGFEVLGCASVYMEQKDRIFPPDALDLYGFLQAGTKGPYRAYYSLKWFSKHGRLGWDFSDVPPPERKTPVVKAKPDQAVAVEPTDDRGLRGESAISLRGWGSALARAFVLLDGLFRCLEVQAHRTSPHGQAHPSDDAWLLP